MKLLALAAVLPASLIFAAGHATAAPKRIPDKRAILAAICERGQVRKGACRRAHGYPEGRSCDIGLTGEGGEGRFLGTDTAYLVVGYTSGCEPHANNWGGSLIFARGARGKLAFLGYQPGMAVTGCIVTARMGGGDRLVCMAGWMGQGYETEIVGEVVLAQDGAGKVTAALEERLAAGRSEGAHGADAVECDKPLVFFGFDGLAEGPDPETITVEADYADAALIASLCAKPDRNATLGTEPPPDNQAYIESGQAAKGRFVYDLGKRALLPAETTASPR